MQGIIVKALSGFYYVRSGGVQYECRARGSFRKEGNSPAVGDSVEFSATDAFHGVVEKINPRKNILVRPSVANIDCLVIVSSYSIPAPDSLMIDRLTAIAVYNGIEPVIVFNKCDMGDFGSWADIYKRAGFRTFVVSALSGEGIAELKMAVNGKICAFAGNSGVGKSSILNALFGDTDIKTGEVSEKLGRGRHTTRHIELYDNKDGGYIVDTPGFSSVEVSDNYDFKTRLAECFPDFADYTDKCRFASCTHTCEKGCGVIEAVKDGKIEESRHRSYCILTEELKDLKPWHKKINK